MSVSSYFGKTRATVLIKKSYVDEEGVKGLLGGLPAIPGVLPDLLSALDWNAIWK